MNRIRELRKARGLSQDDLAKLLGTTTVTFSRWERGVMHPRIRYQKGLAKRLGVSIPELGLRAPKGAQSDPETTRTPDSQ